jgi:hypothetical protein
MDGTDDSATKAGGILKPTFVDVSAIYRRGGGGMRFVLDKRCGPGYRRGPNRNIEMKDTGNCMDDFRRRAGPSFMLR